MTVQTAVTQNLVAGRPGMQATTSPHDEISALIATTAIPFGALVCNQTEGRCNVPDATGEVTGFRVGIALIDPTKETEAGYAIGDVVKVLFRGKAFVLNEEALAFGDTVMARFVAGGAEQLGAFRNDVDGGDAVAVPGARVDAAGGINLAVVELHP